MEVSIKQISREEFEIWKRAKRKYLLVDVREEDEHAMYNIGGILIPLGDIVIEQDKIPKAIPVIFYCKKGIRSQIAIRRLQQKYPYANLYNLAGGIGD